MSLVSTYIKTTDGKWYRNLVYRGEGWFICFDDDDPIELVIRKSSGIKPEDIDLLKQFPKFRLSKPRSSGRNFGGDWLFPAVAYFLCAESQLSFGNPFPAPRETDTYDKVFDEYPNTQGVYYGGRIEEYDTTG